jgi:hypothetical protein
MEQLIHAVLCVKEIVNATNSGLIARLDVKHILEHAHTVIQMV